MKTQSNSTDTSKSILQKIPVKSSESSNDLTNLAKSTFSKEINSQKSIFKNKLGNACLTLIFQMMTSQSHTMFDFVTCVQIEPRSKLQKKFNTGTYAGRGYISINDSNS